MVKSTLYIFGLFFSFFVVIYFQPPTVRQVVAWSLVEDDLFNSIFTMSIPISDFSCYIDLFVTGNVNDVEAKKLAGIHSILHKQICANRSAKLSAMN